MREKLKRGFDRHARAVPWRVANRLVEARVIATLRARRYRRALHRHQPSLPVLDGSRSAIAQALQTAGIVQTDLASLALPGSRAMLTAASELVGRWAAELRQQASAGVEFLTVPAAELAAQPEVYSFGLNPALLELIEAYLGLPVAYDGVTLQYTVADGRAVSTREWHRDREDRRMVKLAVYLTDVDADGGPFQLLPAWRRALPEHGQREFYLDEAERAALDGGRDFVQPISCEGAAGTVVFADTARYFHRGKPATGRDRAALFFSYFARLPQRPYFCERSGLSRGQIAALVQSLSLTPSQQAAALWQRSLPWPWRFIPPAAM